VTRAEMEADLVDRHKRDGAVVPVARDMGFAGRSLKSLTEEEFARLHCAVYLLDKCLTPDDSREGRILNQRVLDLDL
jgi:hypothetical protein